MGILEDLFISPLGHHYTVPATLVYSLVFIVAVWAVHRLLRRLAVPIDRHFILALLPFILLGGSLRALRDAQVLPAPFFVSPFIYGVLFLVTLGALLGSIALERRTRLQYWKLMAAIGAALFLAGLAVAASLGLARPLAPFVFGSFFLASGLLVFALRATLPRLFSPENSLAIFAQLVDASQSFTAVAFFGYAQQFPFVSSLTTLAGPWAIFPLKFAIAAGAVLAIDRWCADPELRTWLKIAIIILGLPMGVRGALRVTLGV